MPFKIKKIKRSKLSRSFSYLLRITMYVIVRYCALFCYSFLKSVVIIKMLTRHAILNRNADVKESTLYQSVNGDCTFFTPVIKGFQMSNAFVHACLLKIVNFGEWILY